MNRNQNLVNFILLSLLVAGCVGSAEPQPPSGTMPTVPAPTSDDTADIQSVSLRSDNPRQTPDVPAASLEKLVAGNSAFAFDLYQQLRAKDGNLFYSPYSISLALAMTYIGARNETAVQMADIMHYAPSSGELHPAFNALDRHLMTTSDGDDMFVFNIANAIWGQAGYPFLPEFLDLLAENYGTGLQSVDFEREPETARQVINQWVSDETDGKIDNLIPAGGIKPLTRLVLTNAIYFNGQWVHPFEVSTTTDQPFFLLDGATVTVPLMTQIEWLAYAEGDGYQAVTLPYRGADMEMMFILPEEARFTEVEGRFSAEMLAAVDTGRSYRNVQLFVPQFNFDADFNLSQILRAMGMVHAFEQTADFSGMTGDRSLFISDVIHKAFVAVDEAGTEAAAATAVISAELSSAPGVEESITVRLDRPFLLVIRDSSTGSIMFAGRVHNPVA